MVTYTAISIVSEGAIDRLMRHAGARAAAVLGVSLLVLPLGGWATPLPAPATAGWLAHTVCNARFVSGRDMAGVRKQELATWPPAQTALLSGVKVDQASRSVSVGAPFPGAATAVMRPGLGCVLLAGRPAGQVAQLRADGPAGRMPEAGALWPQGERVDTTRPIDGVDRARLEKAIDVAFGQCPNGGDPFTRALLVVHGGRIVAERYGADFRPDQAIYGASMSKSVAATLLGLRIAEGRMALDGVALPPDPGRPDPVTNRSLVTMTAGLAWDEDYVSYSDAVRMLLVEPDMAAYAAAKPAVSKPGAVWRYSSGSTNVLMASLRKSFGGDDQAYRNYPRTALFEPLGMRSAMFQTDAAGTLIGSSYLWASPRDWARLGLLYLQDGRWAGRQLLPRSWVDFVRTPAPATAAGTGAQRLNYGAGFWLTGAEAGEPSPVYAMRGYGGQVVRIDPSRDLVVVRLGHTLAECPTFRIDPIAELFPRRDPPARPAS